VDAKQAHCASLRGNPAFLQHHTRFHTVSPRKAIPRRERLAGVRAFAKISLIIPKNYSFFTVCKHGIYPYNTPVKFRTVKEADRPPESAAVYCCLTQNKK